MIYIFAYILAGICDLYSTDRAFRLIPGAGEKHPIWGRVFGDRLSTTQLVGSFAVQASVIIGIMWYFDISYAYLLIVATGHMIAAVRNYIGTNQRISDK